MSIIKDSKIVRSSATIEYEMMLKKLKEAKREAREREIEIKANIESAERTAINRMLKIVATSEKPISAKDISTALDGQLTTNEVAGNLLAMMDNWGYCPSRYQHGQSHTTLEHPAVNIEIPNPSKNNSRIRAKTNTERKYYAEIDKNGNLVKDGTIKSFVEKHYVYYIGKVTED